MHRCRSCGQDKPFSDFYKSKVNKSGYRNYCKTCACKKEQERRDSMSDSQKEDLYDSILDWKESNKESVKIHAKRWRDKQSALAAGKEQSAEESQKD